MTDETTSSEKEPAKPLLTQIQRDRTRIVLAAIICFLLFNWVGKTFHIPVHLGGESSLMQQPSPVVGWIIISIVWFIAAALGTIVVGSIRFDAGLLVASFGLMALSARGGSIRDILLWSAGSIAPNQSNPPPTIYLKLISEIILLFIPIAIGWLLISCTGPSWLNRTSIDQRTTNLENLPKAAEYFLPILVQMICMALFMQLFTAYDAKKQALVTVFVGAFIGTGVAEAVFPNSRAGRFYWLGPMLVAIIGYLLLYRANPTGWIRGDLDGAFAPLARIIPLDYASLGTAGALLGYWVGGEYVKGFYNVFAGEENDEDETLSKSKPTPSASS